MSDYELFVLILESPDGWNILLQEILNICKESDTAQMGRFKADLFNTAALKSTDIAHYLMLQEFPEFQKFNLADDENLITIVNNSPINLSYYLRYCPKQVEKLLEEILGGSRFWRIFENYTVNAQTTEFWKLIISNPQDYTFVHILQSIDQFDAKVDYFIGLLFKSGKLNTQQLQYDIFARFLHKIVYQETPFTNPNTGRSMEEFSVLDKYLNYSISKYISLNILSVSSAPLVYYLINKKRMPLWTYTYLKKLQHITHIRQFKSIIMNKSSETFTSQEALKIMDKLFSLIGNFDGGISSQSLMNMLLEIHVIYGNIKE